MYYKQKIHTWKDNWNDLLRYVLFQDKRLLELMCVPVGTNIYEFTTKYFIQNDSGGQLLTNQKVRILYYDSQGAGTRNKGVLNRKKQFDIYVNDSVLHNANSDRLVNRYDLISQRLKYLIINNAERYGLRFSFSNSFNMWTKTAGYHRYHVVFSYKTTV